MGTIRWLFINGISAYVVWLGANGLGWAENVAVFALWTIAVFGTFLHLSAASDKKFKKKLEKKGLGVPPWLDATFDIGLALFIAAHGWFWTAGAWMWQMICCQAVFTKLGKNK